MKVIWPSLATSQGHELASDWLVFASVGAAVALLVGALILFPLVRWRRQPGDCPPQFNRNDPLELTYTAIPLLVVIALFALTYRIEADVERLGSRPDARVHVVGFQWSWRFDYPGTSIAVAGTPQHPPQLVLPLGRTTEVTLDSSDVIHTFWVPGFLFKRDAIPGMQNAFDLHPLHTGTFAGVCAEFCGLEHTHMTFSVRVVPVAAYMRWLDSNGRSLR